MNGFVEFPLDSGGTILVQVPDADSIVTRGLRDHGAQVAAQAQESFEKAVDRIRPAADALLASMTGLTHLPDEITIEFAVQLSAEAGVVIASLGSTATFKIELKWARSTQHPGTTIAAAASPRT